MVLLLLVVAWQHWELFVLLWLFHHRYTCIHLINILNISQWLLKRTARRVCSKLMRHGNEIANVSVSVDGTWQKRYSHNSLLGASFIISVGLVLDYVIKSKTCQVCKRNPDASEDWKKAHKSVCEINHTQSSGVKEKEAAVEMFINSIERRKLRYVEYVGDGDKNSFGAVVQA